MTQATSRPLHCLFYSHVWAVHMLKKANLGAFEKLILVELATTSNFAPVFGLQSKPRFGLAGLLQLGRRLEQLGQPLKYVPAPVVLAPNPRIPAATLCSAVAVLPYTNSQYEKVVLLVHINEAIQFAEAYPYISEFSIFWDIADTPSQSLVRLAELLADNQCLSKERWQGFKLYRHPNRALPDADARQAALESVLNEYPSLKGQAS